MEKRKKGGGGEWRGGDRVRIVSTVTSCMSKAPALRTPTPTTMSPAPSLACVTVTATLAPGGAEELPKRAPAVVTTRDLTVLKGRACTKQALLPTGGPKNNKTKQNKKTQQQQQKGEKKERKKKRERKREKNYIKKIILLSGFHLSHT